MNKEIKFAITGYYLTGILYFACIFIFLNVTKFLGFERTLNATLVVIKSRLKCTLVAIKTILKCLISGH